MAKLPVGGSVDDSAARRGKGAASGALPEPRASPGNSPTSCAVVGAIASNLQAARPTLPDDGVRSSGEAGYEAVGAYCGRAARGRLRPGRRPPEAARGDPGAG